MPMDAARLGAAIKAAVGALPPGDVSIPPVPDGSGGFNPAPANVGTALDANAAWTAIAQAIITEIQTHSTLKIGTTAAFDGMQNGTTHPGVAFTSPEGVVT